MNQAAAKSRIQELEEENARLKAQKSGGQPLRLKVSGKGGVSLYGLGRFPTTLYVEQWEKLLTMTDEIRQFLVDHAEELKRKD